MLHFVQQITSKETTASIQQSNEKTLIEVIAALLCTQCVIMYCIYTSNTHSWATLLPKLCAYRNKICVCCCVCYCLCTHVHYALLLILHYYSTPRMQKCRHVEILSDVCIVTKTTYVHRYTWWCNLITHSCSSHATTYAPVRCTQSTKQCTVLMSNA